MRGGFSGQWWTEGGAPGGGLVLLVIGAAVLLGSGAAAATATAVIIALIAATAVVVLAVAGLTAYLVHRARRGQPVMRPSVIITGRDPLPPAAPRALEPPAPREVHQHWHLHVGAGTDAGQVAAIMRQIKREG